MHIVARIPVKGYVPGQTINVEVDVDNKSEANAEFSVKLFKVNIYDPKPAAWLPPNRSIQFSFQDIIYQIYPNGEKQRQESILICEKSRIGRSRMYSVESYRVSLLIPPIPPTDTDSSKICKVRYFLQVSEDVEWQSYLCNKITIRCLRFSAMSAVAIGTPVLKYQ